MGDAISKIYQALPVWAQNLGLGAYGMMWRNRRYGGRFLQYVEEFAERESLSPDGWKVFQEEQLARLLAYSVQHVPYYRKSLAGLRLPDSLSDLPSLPLLTKDELRRAPDGFVGDDLASRNLNKYQTSGTTGTPLQITMSTDAHRRWAAAYETRVRRWAGVHYKLSRAMIGGRIVAPDGRPPLWRYNFAENQLYFSAFHISRENTPHYVAALNKYKPAYLVGYASSHFFLARFASELGLQVHRPRAVLLSSEKLTSSMRAMISAVYKCPVFDAYSGVESCCLASECEHHRLHVSPDVGIVELVDEVGNPVPVGAPGEIVATGFLNRSQPLIRYRTGDVGILSDEACPCGRSMPILRELIGRLEDTVIGPDGRELVRFHGIFIGLPHVLEGQVIQESLALIRLRLVVGPAFGDGERGMILERFRERLGEVEIQFELVDRIEQSDGGKFRAVISKVEREPRARDDL